MPETSHSVSLGLPDFLLHKVDPSSNILTFLPTSSALLRKASFIDGRSPISHGKAIECGIDTMEGADPPLRHQRRFIFHVAFCGSTFLSRILDWRGKTLVAREPNCLVDIADWKTSHERTGRTTRPTSQLTELACSSLFGSSASDEAIVVKPSNWTNNLLPELCDANSRAVFVVTQARSFLRAVFRGGRNRLAFVARAAALLAAGRAGDDMLMAAAVKSSTDPLDQIAHMAALLHHMQMSRFREAMKIRHWSNPAILFYEDIVASPDASAEIANRHLGLNLTTEEISRNVAEKRKRHAKDGTAPFDANILREIDESVEAHHGRRIDTPLAWYRDCVPDLPAPFSPHKVDDEPGDRSSAG
jgi:hypothetical protein